MPDPIERRPSAPEPSLAETVDGAVRRIATSIAIAGIAVALAIYARPGPPRFEAFATEQGIVRVDTRKGTVIGCEGGRCMVLLRSGQDLAPNPNVDEEGRANPPLPAPARLRETEAPAESPPATPTKAPAQAPAAVPAPAPAGR